jgi:hypothetical protein
MGFSRVGYLRVVVAAAGVLGCAAIGSTPATAGQTAAAAGSTFKVLITPAFTTAQQPTTFLANVTNTSAPGTTLRSVQLTAPRGFKLSPPPNTPLGQHMVVQGRTLTVRRISVAPGQALRFPVTATAPSKCSRSALAWTARGFKAANASGTQLSLQSALSQLALSVLCPGVAPCGDGGPPCSTRLVTSNSTYAVISNASAGTLRQTVNVGKPLTCGSYRFRDPNWWGAAVVSTTQTPITAPISIFDHVTYKIRNTTAKGIGFCLGAAYDFTTASGNKAKARPLPNGNAGFVGLLPRCSRSKPPCIASVSQKPDASAKTGFDAVMKVNLPENGGDPWAHG